MAKAAAEEKARLAAEEDQWIHRCIAKAVAEDWTAFDEAPREIRSLVWAELMGGSIFAMKLKTKWLGKARINVDKLRDAPKQLLADGDFMAVAAAQTDGAALRWASTALLADADFNRKAHAALAEHFNEDLPEDERDQQRFTSHASLNAGLADGSTALVLASYLISLADQGRPLSHRAALPPEAFLPEGTPIWRHDTDGRDESVYNVVLVVALSYMWQSADHPDPDGGQLRDVARFLRWLQSTEKYKKRTVAVFWDWASLYQDKPGEGLAGSRTEEQALSFQSGSQNVHLWFGHTKVISLLSTSQPPGRSFDYFEGGWTTFEKFVSEFRKHKSMVLVLEEVFKVLDDEAVKDPQYRFARLNKESYDKVAEVSGKSAHRSLAVAPDSMDDVLARKKFTESADIGVLQDLYRKSFHAVVCEVTELNFGSAAGEDAYSLITTEEWQAFCRDVVPLCVRLETLSLNRNAHLAVDIAELVAKLPPTLKELNLNNTGCSGDAGKADWARLEVLEEVRLEATQVTGSYNDLRIAGCKARAVWI
jgi:hypothetical protein